MQIYMNYDVKELKKLILKLTHKIEDDDYGPIFGKKMFQNFQEVKFVRV